jgi:hypothetical protein
LTGVPMNREEPANDKNHLGIAWDRREQSAIRTPASDQARLEAVLDQLEPNRPAEIKSATARPTTAKTAESGQPGGSPFFKQKRIAPK